MLINLLFGGGIGYSATYVYDSETGWQRVPAREIAADDPYRRNNTSYRWEFLPLLFFVASIVIGYITVIARRGQGGGGVGGGQPQRRTQRTHSERLSAAASLIQKLPIEVYYTKEDIDAMAVSQLKEILESRGKKETADGCLEKKELIDALLSADGNTTTESCSICVEDYISGDALRVLPCGHKFHLECLDRWLLSSTDYSQRRSACPMCNADLEEEPTIRTGEVST